MLSAICSLLRIALDHSCQLQLGLQQLCRLVLAETITRFPGSENRSKGCKKSGMRELPRAA